MITSIIISIIALFFAIIGSRDKNTKGLEIAFVIITIFSCLRYNFGTDYMSYMESFNRDYNYSIDTILSDDDFKDKGWFIIGKYLHPLGWFVFVALLSIYCNIVYYKYIKKYAPQEYYWLSFFLYVFTFDMFMLQQSMIRQGWAIALMLNAYMLFDDFDIKHKWRIIGAFVITVLAISIHKSAAFAIPFMLLKFAPLRWGKFLALGMISLFFMSFIVIGTLETFVSEILLIEEFSTFESDYGEMEGTKIGVRAILECIPIFVGGYYLSLKKTEGGPRFIVAVSMITPMILPLTTIIHMILRVSFYFSIFYLATIPITYMEIKNKLLKVFFVALLMILTLYVYFDRFNAESYRNAYAEYHTIFSVL